MKSEEYIQVWMDEAIELMIEKGIFHEFNERLKKRIQGLTSKVIKND